MAQHRSFDELMARLRSGDNDAATAIFQRFARRLLALARSRLDLLVRRKVDPEDVLQSVFESFFARHVDGQFRLEDWDGLWGMLVVLTVRKCGRRVGYFHAARRDVQREAQSATTQQSDADCAAIAREPTPSEAAMLTETVQQLMQRLEGRDRQILTLSLQGHNVAEISARIGRTERTVQRVLERIRKWLERMRADEAFPGEQRT
jgi:RNA polymerase sigma-70 factor (ECF subfamily)